MDEMNAELWSGLLTEIIERTLPFLSVPVLCRFRTVCKRWNSLICHPEFGALCIQRAWKDSLFLAARYTIHKSEGYYGWEYVDPDDNHGWSFMDLDTRRWYTIKKDRREVFDCHWRRGNMAMDKGLVCQFLVEAAQGEVMSILISNPVAKTFKRLPTSPYIDRSVDRAVMDMVVDGVAQNYKIFVIPDTSSRPRNAAIIIYDSTTNQWRLVVFPPEIDIRLTDVKSSVCFHGLLYLLMDMREDYNMTPRYQLWSYNYAEDSWNDTYVPVGHLELVSPQLIVSDNRLFLGSWIRQQWRSELLRSRDAYSRRWSYEINEINLEARSRTQVFESFGDHLKQWVQHFSSGSSDEKRAPLSIKAFGFRKSIILTSDLSGASKVYDLSTHSWELLPRNPLMQYLQGDMRGRDRSLNFGKPMNLFLQASPMWERESGAGF